MTDPRLRERLLDLEPETPNLRAKYEEEIKNMYDKTLTPMQRNFHIGSIIIGIILFFGFSIAFFELAPYVQFHTRAMSLVTAIIAAACSVTSARILYRGKVDRRLDWNLDLTLGWIGAVLIFALCFITAIVEDSHFGIAILLLSMTAFLIAMLGTIVYCIQRSQLKTEETLLRMQLQIAEMNEKLGGSSPQPESRGGDDNNG